MSDSFLLSLRIFRESHLVPVRRRGGVADTNDRSPLKTPTLIIVGPVPLVSKSCLIKRKSSGLSGRPLERLLKRMMRPPGRRSEVFGSGSCSYLHVLLLHLLFKHILPNTRFSSNWFRIIPRCTVQHGASFNLIRSQLFISLFPTGHKYSGRQKGKMSDGIGIAK